MSRAVIAPRFGDEEVLRVGARPPVAPSAGEVRIRVEAVAVSPIDLMIRRGEYADYFDGLGIRPPYVLGYDAAGVVEEVGPDVDRLGVGMRVMAAVLPHRPLGGAYQESLTVPAASVVPVPDGATAAQASTLPMNGLTALVGLSVLDLSPGGWLYVTGGAGWLATLTIALAAERGIRVIADAHPADRELVRASGATHVVDRGPDAGDRVLELVPGGVDGLFDTAKIGPSLARTVRDGGIRGIVALEDPPSDDPRIRLGVVGMVPYVEDTVYLEEIRVQASRGRLPMSVARVLPIEQAAEAHRIQARGGVRGRIVLEF